MTPLGPARRAIPAQLVQRRRAFEREAAQWGHLPGNPFQRVLDMALSTAGLSREDIYVTQRFAAIHASDRSGHIRPAHYRATFETVGKHELAGRRVLALGREAKSLCDAFGVPATLVAHHPGARGKGMTVAHKAGVLAAALRAAMNETIP